ncbi:outer membrane protein assembly factor BamB family protein [Phytohabitans rumicis]|uniref:outer membrane protein assembly factor BamB family protein n=1 Tax=Phytohabitans rumicis TaxID=1076125 RepID=UPI0015652951|nr:PQQ-binding-like beta-propeller repeat protein [Phytohabitans rumicis]
MAVIGVIDLGEVGHGSPPVEPEPARPRFGWALAGLAALAVLLGPATPLPVPLTEATIPARLGDTSFAVGDRFYVVTNDRAVPADTRTISAYGLPDARLLWEAPLPLKGALRGVGLASGQMLISTQPELLEQVESVSIREDTGTVSWRRRALFEGVTPRGHVLLWTSPDGAPTAGTGTEVLEAVDPVTGVVRWSYRVPTGAWLSYRYVDDAPTHVVTLLPSGLVEVRDAEDGRVLVSADLLPARLPNEPASYVQFAGDLMLVREGGPVVSAYGLTRLELRWRSPIDLATEYISPNCGETVCVVSHIGGVRVLDPATGRILWSDPDWSFVVRAGAYLISGARGRESEVPLVVLDPATGAQVGELGIWSVIGPPDSAGQLIGMRSDLATARAWFARLDPATGAARVFGVVGDVTGDCEVWADAVLCRRLNATVGVWRPIMGA